MLRVCIKGDVALWVPNTLSCMTTYALLEQEDWFEPELAFARAYLRPGMGAVDIGANYGVYSLTMARAVGATGSVWSFEPASDVGAALQRSADDHGFAWLKLHQEAVGASAGTVSLSDGVSEVRSVVAGSGGDVPMVTLDGWWKAAGSPQVDFIKIDAEGGEPDIIRGGGSFFKEQSPVVQIEVRAATDVVSDAANLLIALGYELYRVLPGALALVPIAGPLTELDPFQLNVLAIKPERAEQMRADGWVVDEADRFPTTSAAGTFRAWADAALSHQQWPGLRGAVAQGGPLELALDALLAGERAEGTPRDRAAAILFAQRGLDSLFEEMRTFERGFAQLRLAAAAGKRGRIAGVVQLLMGAVAGGSLTLNEPVIPAVERYASLKTSDLGLWLVAQLEEVVLRWCAHSTQYAPKALSLRGILEVGETDDDVERRIQLIFLRNEVIQGVGGFRTPGGRAPSTLNRELWERGDIRV